MVGTMMIIIMFDTRISGGVISFVGDNNNIIIVIISIMLTLRLAASCGGAIDRLCWRMEELRACRHGDGVDSQARPFRGVQRLCNESPAFSVCNRSATAPALTRS